MRRIDPADVARPVAPRPRAAFTLLEVLAAVMIFAIAFTTLAGHTMSWVRAEGVSNRRLRASLLADERLTDLEGRIAMGETPPIGEDQTDQDEFSVTISVDPWQPPVDLADLEAAAGSGAPPAASLLQPSQDDPDGVLRRIRVVVRWDEGFEEHLVSRTTFAVDSAAAKQRLESAGFPAGGAGADATDGAGADDTAGSSGRQTSGDTEP